MIDPASSTTATRTVRNTMIMLASQVTTFGLAAVAMLVVPVYLGPERFGKLFFATVYSSLLAIGVDLGLDTYLLKEVPRRGQDAARLLANGLALKTALFAVVYLLGMGAVWALGYDRETFLVTAVFMLSILTYGWIKSLTSVFQGFDRFGDPTVGLIVEKTVYTAGAVALLVGGLAAGFDVQAVAAAFVLSTLVHLAILARRIQRLVPLRFAFDWPTWKELFFGTLPFLIWAVFSKIYLYIDGTMLSLMAAPAVLGWYGVAMRLYGTLLFIPHILSRVLLPALSSLQTGGRDRTEQAGRKAVCITLVLATPASAGLLLTADRVIALLYGADAYGPSAGSLRLLAVGLIPIYLSMILASVLIAMDRQKEWSRMAILAAVMNIGLNSVGIPLTERWYGNGGLGAAAATAATEFFVLLYCWKLLPAGFFDGEIRATAWRCAVSAGLMSGVVLASGRLPLPAVIGIGTVVYCAAIFATGGVAREDLAVVIGMVRRRKEAHDAAPLADAVPASGRVTRTAILSE